jgi:hypothetical protein
MERREGREGGREGGRGGVGEVFRDGFWVCHKRTGALLLVLPSLPKLEVG